MADTEEENRKPTRVWLLEQIELFLSNNPSMSPEGFGWNACRNTSLVERLRKGGDTTTTNLDKVIAFLGSPHQSRRSYSNRTSKPSKE